jgi:HEAT repeat protein
MAFKKGQSGNPSGRPKQDIHLKELAKSFTQEAVDTLAQVMRDSSAPPAARVKASECLLDRAWGKAETNANVNVSRDVKDLSTAEILAALAAFGTTGAEEGGDESRGLH